MKKLEKLEKYVAAPNLAFYGGFRYDGEDIFLCDDHDADGEYDFRVRQRIEGGRLVTELSRTYERKNGQPVTEQSQLSVGLTKGELLVYVEGIGFTVPEYAMCTVDEAMRRLGLLKNEEVR